MSFIPYAIYSDKLGSHYKDVFSIVDDELLNLTNQIVGNLKEKKEFSTKNKYLNYKVDFIKAEDENSFGTYKFTISAPGFNKNDFEILLDESAGGVLKVKSKKENVFNRNVDIKHNFFTKNLKNIKLDSSNVKASLDLGILTIEVPSLKLKSKNETLIEID